MRRKNIFDILSENIDIDEEISKIKMLVWKNAIINAINSYDIESFVDEYCLLNWKQRERYLSCEEIRCALELEIFVQQECCYDEQDILIYLEYLCNIIWLCNKYIQKEKNCNILTEYIYLQENVKSLIESLNYDIQVFPNSEKVLLVEKNAATTAVAEILDVDAAYETIEYNHYLLKGDIGKKQKILKVLADKVEPMRGELKRINKDLESNVGYLLNKMNIRHNNIEGKNAIEYVKNLPEEEIEAWYDETYQMLLLCILEFENIERNKKVSDLKKLIEA